MERTMWTDERLDDLAQRMDAGFDRLDREIRDLRLVMLQIGGAMMVGLVGVIATVLASG
jgi:hypothetical protein